MKRSVNFHRPPKGVGLNELADMVGMSADEKRQMAQDIAADIERQRAAKLAAANWRVVWRKTASDAWTEEYFTSRVMAYDRKHVLRSRLCAAMVQTRHADGRWIDG